MAEGDYFTELDGAPAGASRTGTATRGGRSARARSAVLAVAYADDGKLYASTADDGVAHLD